MKLHGKSPMLIILTSFSLSGLIGVVVVVMLDSLRCCVVHVAADMKRFQLGIVLRALLFMSATIRQGRREGLPVESTYNGALPVDYCSRAGTRS